MLHDDLGSPFPDGGAARRVVSLVPSLTEAVASVRPETLVGVTDWCTHPSDLDTTRVRGTKNPDVARIVALRPDVVLANKEENRELDVRRLRERGVPVWVTDIETVPQAVASLERMFSAALRWEPPAWLAEVRETWCRPVAPATRSVVVPIWRDPWMVVGPRTFANDLVRRLGWRNLWDTDGADRYPRVTPEEIVAARPDCVLLPDEPYVFTADDGPEAFTSLRCELVSGRLLTWYGPSLLEARATALARP